MMNKRTGKLISLKADFDITRNRINIIYENVLYGTCIFRIRENTDIGVSLLIGKQSFLAPSLLFSGYTKKPMAFSLICAQGSGSFCLGISEQRWTNTSPITSTSVCLLFVSIEFDIGNGTSLNCKILSIILRIFEGVKMLHK